ncbi:hypothetical protein OR214_02264 [Ralstonia pickettii OR214]|jgi:hypothetical protein|uniref:Uncharacterized protein n=1 Tax=Ralstonia pickettii OR214 TaxID=1264675 RepID=R0DX32_RALPI|nr:hypothetical protein OR214_02264 [Ralstonia pickettii OR214]
MPIRLVSGSSTNAIATSTSAVPATAERAFRSRRSRKLLMSCFHGQMPSQPVQSSQDVDVSVALSWRNRPAPQHSLRHTGTVLLAIRFPARSSSRLYSNCLATGLVSPHPLSQHQLWPSWRAGSYFAGTRALSSTIACSPPVIRRNSLRAQDVRDHHYRRYWDRPFVPLELSKTSSPEPRRSQTPPAGL